MIVNLTQHPATSEQIAEGVADLEGDQLHALRAALTFESAPSADEIVTRATTIAELARYVGANSAMIGGAPYLMGHLAAALARCGITPRYSFSSRVSEEQTQPDGTVRKVQIFRHTGWVTPWTLEDLGP